jgi:RimJ/RimL family protein N-acetyltransferase
MRWLGGVADAATRAAARARVESYQRDHGHTFWVAERKEDGALLGFCGLKRSNQAGGPQGMMEVGWRLREDAWGHGYAKEAAAASLDLAFDRFGADEVIALTVQGNTASWGLMLRLGMVRRVDLDFASPDFDPDNPVIIAYAITRAEWQAAA